ETDEEWFERYMKNRTKEVRLAIVTQDEDELIGMASIVNIDTVSRKAEYGGIMIGVPVNRGKGIGKLVTMMLLRHAFYDLNLNRIQGVWLVSNIPSVEMGKKCGFREEGVLRQATFKNGQYHDLLLMSILRMEFDEIAKNYEWI
ncbi:MAG TPA: GNAT family protein, partial [Mesotoga infera]|nr:GNAT family protein [Mesotoga infera]